MLFVSRKKLENFLNSKKSNMELIMWIKDTASNDEEYLEERNRLDVWDKTIDSLIVDINQWFGYNTRKNKKYWKQFNVK